MKAKSLIRYKIRYNPDTKEKSKSVEVEKDGAKLIYVIPIVSDKKDIEFMIKEQIGRSQASHPPTFQPQDGPPKVKRGHGEET